MAGTEADLPGTIDEIAAAWRAARPDRQARRHLERADFDLLRDAGLLKLPAPRDAGGWWDGPAASTRRMCETYRRLASADPSVALVSCMHPAVLAFWLASPDPAQPEWERQRRAVFERAVAGEQWGTITSEPGSGGDIARTRTTATPLDPAVPTDLPGRVYAVTGDKHFGSGSGVTDRMMTTAVPSDADTGPTIFVLDVRDRSWDGRDGLRLTAEWDGMGMAATQSHAMRLEAIPAVRLAWGGPLDPIARAASPFISVLFAGVVLGVLEAAVATARRQVSGKAEQLRSFEQVEWARAEMEHWLAVQAYEGAVRAVVGGDPAGALHAALRAKQSVADLAETALLRITRVLGGGTFSGRSPFAHWFEDVRALGFLRPPWALAFDSLFATSLEVPPAS
jgi:alkylation response protein AidB-like acyl-CoA dehydrogenase